MSLVKVALLRSTGLVALPALLLLEVLNALARRADYSQTWLATSSWSGAALILLGPLVIGLAAAESVWWVRSGASSVPAARGVHLLRPHGSRLLAIWFWACVAHLVGVLLTWGFTVVEHGEFGPIHVEVVLPSALVLLACASLGSGLGWVLPSAFIPPVLAVLAYLLPAFSWGVTSNHAVVGGATAALVGMEYRPPLLVAQAIWFTALSALGLSVLFTARTWGRLTVVLAAVGVLVSGQAVTKLGDSPLRPVERMDLACEPTPAAPVCVPAELERALPDVVSSVELPARRASTLGWNGRPPTRLVASQNSRSDGDLPVPVPVGAEASMEEVTLAITVWMVPCLEQTRKSWENVEPVVAYLSGQDTSDPATGERALSRLEATCRAS